VIKTRSESAWLLLQWILGIVDFKICEQETEPVRADIDELESNIKKEQQTLQNIKNDLAKNRTLYEKHSNEITLIEREILNINKEIDQTKLRIEI